MSVEITSDQGRNDKQGRDKQGTCKEDADLVDLQQLAPIGLTTHSDFP